LSKAWLSNITCSYNTRANGNGGCIAYSAASLLIDDSRFTNNFVAPPGCGGAIVVQGNATGDVMVMNSEITQNTVDFGGAFCMSDIANCAPDSRVLLTAWNNTLTPNEVKSGGVVYFARTPNSNLTVFPACLATVYIQTTNILPWNPSFRYGVFHATYPYRLKTPRKYLKIEANNTAYPNVAVIDFFGQAVYPQACNHYTICAKSLSPNFTITDSPAVCGLDSVLTYTAPNTTPGNYTIAFGGSPAVCTSPPQNLLPYPDITASYIADYNIPSGSLVPAVALLSSNNGSPQNK